MADLLKFTLLLTSLTFPLGAKDYGVHGKVFHIEEEDLIDYIRNRIKTLDVDKLQEKSTHCLKHPTPVTGLSEAKTYAMHYFDPTVVAKEDVKDGEGNTIIPKGSSYNPLDCFSLTQDLLFFDGDNQEHIAWAKGCGNQTKWILVKGNPFPLEEEHARPIFFDQHGTLVQKLSIQAIPSRISQEGKRLKVETLPIKEMSCGS